MRSDELIAKKLDGELSTAEAAELDALLSSDPDLAQELAELEELESALNVETEVHSASARAFRQDHKAELQSALMSDAPRRPGGVYWIGGLLVLASAALLFWSLESGNPPPAQDAQVADLMHNPPAPPSAVEAETPVEMPSQESADLPAEAAADGAPPPSSRPEQPSVEPVETPSTETAAAEPQSEVGDETDMPTPKPHDGLGAASLDGGSSREAALRAEITRLNNRIKQENIDLRRAVLLRRRGLIERLLGDAGASRGSLEQALKLVQNDNAAPLESEILSYLALAAKDVGDLNAAREYKRRALALSPKDSLSVMRDRLKNIM